MLIETINKSNEENISKLEPIEKMKLDTTELELKELKNGEYEYLPKDYKFSINDIANMIGESPENINSIRQKLGILSSTSYDQDEAVKIIDYLANPSKYQAQPKTNDLNNKVANQSQMTSKDWWVVGGIALGVTAIVYLFTRNRAVTGAAWRGSNTLLRGTQTARYAAGSSAAYIAAQAASAQAAANAANLANIVGIVSTIYGISPIYKGPRGGVFRYTSSGNKHYL